MLDEEAAAQLDAQSGIAFGDDGPSRFFYTTKVNRAEREAGCFAIPEKEVITKARRCGTLTRRSKRSS